MRGREVPDARRVALLRETARSVPRYLSTSATFAAEEGREYVVESGRIAEACVVSSLRYSVCFVVMKSTPGRLVRGDVSWPSND